MTQTLDKPATPVTTQDDRQLVIKDLHVVPIADKSREILRNAPMGRDRASIEQAGGRECVDACANGGEAPCFSSLAKQPVGDLVRE